jgi:hypothetical protein
MEIDLASIEGLSEAQVLALTDKFKSAHDADVVGLKSKNSELLESMRTGKEASTKLEQDNALAAEKLAEAQGNYEEAKRLSDDRVNSEKLSAKAREDGYKGQLSDLYVTQATTGLAKEIANTPEDIEVLEMFLQKHITMKDVDGKMQTDYGQAGNREALIEQFKKDPLMARFLSGTKAVGVGAKGAEGSGKASAKDVSFIDMNTEQKAQYLKDNPIKRQG